MKWKSRYFFKDMEGDERIIKGFLFLPRCLGKSHYWHWLKWVLIKQRICKIDIGGSMEWGKYTWKWENIDFVCEK